MQSFVVLLTTALMLCILKDYEFMYEWMKCTKWIERTKYSTVS